MGSLVAAAAAGDEAAWRELVHRYLDFVWSIARSAGLGHCDAADVTQTTWLRFAESLDRLTEPDRAGAWLATTARREAFRVARERRRQVPSEHVPLLADREGAVLAEPVGERLDRAEDDRRVAAAFSSLSPRCQRLLRTLVADPAPSYAEVAAALEMPVGSIGPTRARCLEALRAELAAVPVAARPAPDRLAAEREVS